MTSRQFGPWGGGGGGGGGRALPPMVTIAYSELIAWPFVSAHRLFLLFLRLNIPLLIYLKITDPKLSVTNNI